MEEYSREKEKLLTGVKEKDNDCTLSRMMEVLNLLIYSPYSSGRCIARLPLGLP